MNDDASFSKPPMWDWASWMKSSIPNPLDLFAPPRNLDQPILPGWGIGNQIINVTEQNSSAPDTERDIVAKHSYGSQLGCIIDAVDCLINKLPKEDQSAEAFREFKELREKIDEIKSRAAERRLNGIASNLGRIASDLAILKENKVEYDRIVEKLRKLLD